ncbi:MAG: acyltransferase [Eubacteriales bacterium]
MKKELEILRFYCFLCVVLQHILGSYITLHITYETSVVLGILFVLIKFSVPCFFFISGFVSFQRPVEEFSCGKFLKRRTLSLLVPYLVFGVIFTWWKELPLFSLDFLQKLVTGQVHYHTWYVFTLVLLYLAMPLVVALFRWLETRSKTTALALVLCCGALLYLAYPLFQNVPILGYLFYEKGTWNPCYYLPYFLVGALVSKGYDKVAFGKKWPFFALCTGATFANSLYCLIEASNGKINLNFVPTISLSSYLLSFSFIFLGLCLAIFLERVEFVAKPAVCLAKFTFIAYLYHTLFMELLNKHMQELPYTVKYLSMFLLTTCLSLGAGYLWNLGQNLWKKRKKA